MDAPYSSNNKFPGVPVKIAAIGLLFSNNSNYGYTQFPGVPLKIAGRRPAIFQ